MKPYALRPRAREDRRSEVGYCRREAGVKVAARLVDALQQALDELKRQPGIGSPRLGHDIGVDGMRTWIIEGFPLCWWYFERENHIDVVRLVGQRQDASEIELGQE